MKQYGCKYIYKATFNDGDLTLNSLNYKFSFIKYFYTIMKSGINLNNRLYQHSYLFDYMHLKNIDNEKAYLKEKKIAPNLITNKNVVKKEQHNKNPHYVRALLGVGNELNFRTSATDPKERLKIKIKSNAIERYPSPVIFELINNNIYILMNNKQESLYNKEFTFSKDKDNKIVLTTIPDEFNKDDFLKSYVNNCWNKIYFNIKDKGGRKVTLCE